MRPLLIGLTLVAVLLLTTGLQRAGAFAFNAPFWSAVTSGGGVSSSTNFALYGALGQPLDGTSSSANFAVTSGFIQDFGPSGPQYVPLTLKGAQGS